MFLQPPTHKPNVPLGGSPTYSGGVVRNDIPFFALTFLTLWAGAPHVCQVERRVPWQIVATQRESLYGTPSGPQTFLSAFPIFVATPPFFFWAFTLIS